MEISHPLQMNVSTNQRLIQGQKDEAIIQDLKRQVNLK